MLKPVVWSMLLIVPSAAFADADCTANPKSEWKTEQEARAKFEAEGYTIRKFKVSGNCYEFYGFTRDGKKAEVYFDTKTLEVVKSEIDD